jgi:lipid-binding SYLF domain-containing protein
MFRSFVAAALALLAAPLAAGAAQAQTAEQAVVDRATLTVQEMLGGPDKGQQIDMLRRARAVMVCPQIFRAGFLLGGSGGQCVLVARDGAGSWSAPAFFHIGTGSIGFQAGIQDSEVMMMILTPRGLGAIMDSSFKFGGDASIAVATVGAGVEGATTAALSADIVAFSQTRGLFAGIALNGSLLTSQTRANRAYYGQDLAARQIVLQMQANNPGADPLRQMLMHFSGAPSAPAPRPGAYGGQPGYAPQQPYEPPPGGYAQQQGGYQPNGYQQGGYQPGGYSGSPPSGPQPLAPIQQQNLDPPRR